MWQILLVDDEEMIRDFIQDVLAGLDVNITAISSGLEAVTMTRAQHPDLVIMDIVLANAGIDGVEAARLIKRHPQTHDTKIILMSGVIDLRAEEIERIGVDAVLPKPFKASKLRRLVTQMMAEKYPDAKKSVHASGARAEAGEKGQDAKLETLMQ
jgi:CheY-like chemotaxis protein